MDWHYGMNILLTAYKNQRGKQYELIYDELGREA
jgi:YD repeat-containing protein